MTCAFLEELNTLKPRKKNLPGYYSNKGLKGNVVVNWALHEGLLEITLSLLKLKIRKIHLFKD